MHHGAQGRETKPGCHPGLNGEKGIGSIGSTCGKGNRRSSNIKVNGDGVPLVVGGRNTPTPRW